MPFKVKEFPYPLRVGVDMKSVFDLHLAFESLPNSFDFMMFDICNQSNFRDQKTITSRDIALTRTGKLDEILIKFRDLRA